MKETHDAARLGLRSREVRAEARTILLRLPRGDLVRPGRGAGQGKEAEMRKPNAPWRSQVQWAYSEGVHWLADREVEVTHAPEALSHWLHGFGRVTTLIKHYPAFVALIQRPESWRQEAVIGSRTPMPHWLARDYVTVCAAFRARRLELSGWQASMRLLQWSAAPCARAVRRER